MEEGENGEKEGARGDSWVSGLHGHTIHKDGTKNKEMCLEVMWERLEIWVGPLGCEMSSHPSRGNSEQADGSEAQRGSLGWHRSVWGRRWSLFSPAADPDVHPGNQLLPAPSQSWPVRRLHDSQSIPGCTR